MFLSLSLSLSYNPCLGSQFHVDVTGVRNSMRERRLSTRYKQSYKGVTRVAEIKLADVKRETAATIISRRVSYGCNRARCILPR